MSNETSIVRYGLKKHKVGLVSAALATTFLMSPGIIQAAEVDEGSAIESANYDNSHTLDDSAQSQSVYSENHTNDLNDYRAENGEAPLVEQDDLNAFAKWKIDALGEEMPTIDEIREFRENGGNIHEFNGRTVTEQYEDFYGVAPEGPLGENVAYFKNIPGTDTSDGLNDVTMDTWINSPAHDRNMKEDGYGSVGSAYYMDGDGTYYTVQIFETGEREVVEVAPEDIPEDEEVIEEAPATPEPEVEQEVETDAGADEVVPAEPEVEEPVTPEPETDAEQEVEVTEPEADTSDESDETEIEVEEEPEVPEAVEPDEEDVEDTEQEPTPETDTESEDTDAAEDGVTEETDENTDEPVESEEEAPVDSEPSETPDEDVTETVETDNSADAESDEVAEDTPTEADDSEEESEPADEPSSESDDTVTPAEVKEDVSDDTPVSSDQSADGEVNNSNNESPVVDTVSSEQKQSAPEVVETVKTPVEAIESDSEMIAEAPDTPVTPVESDDTTLAVEGNNGSDDTEIAPQDTPVSDEIESSDEITPVVEETVETNTSVDETAVNADENPEDEQMLPNTGVADQTMPVVLGSIMAFFGGIALWFSRKRKTNN